jgi:uncharacterized protein YndB with AHSA1/START domain
LAPVGPQVEAESLGYQVEDRVSMGRRPETFSIALDRTIGAPRDFAWRVWTEAESLKRWYRPDDSWATPVAEIDLRVGGHYRLGLTPPQSSTFYEVGNYLTVNVPELLVYTVRFEGMHPRFEGPRLDSPTDEEMETYVTMITVRFEPLPGDETRVFVRQDGYRSERDRDRHREGWPRFLDHFVRYCETGG